MSGTSPKRFFVSLIAEGESVANQIGGFRASLEERHKAGLSTSTQHQHQHLAKSTQINGPSALYSGARWIP